MGVGISPDTFKPVPAAIFSGLQKDTESKTKHYGCYCWSKNILPHNDNENDNNITSFIFHNIDFPLTIQQRTPVRVLHRRCNMIRERKVICANAIRIDDHHFRLEISTQAGTYVKEFVYGDFGRTIPSVSSIMGCKTNLLKLDCEGIEIPLSPSSMDINGGGSSSSTTT
jgi:tRNA pseudouridine synthase 10